jgi:hypothetical protein
MAPGWYGRVVAPANTTPEGWDPPLTATGQVFHGAIYTH